MKKLKICIYPLRETPVRLEESDKRYHFHPTTGGRATRPPDAYDPAPRLDEALNIPRSVTLR